MLKPIEIDEERKYHYEVEVYVNVIDTVIERLRELGFESIEIAPLEEEGTWLIFGEVVLGVYTIVYGRDDEELAWHEKMEEVRREIEIDGVIKKVVRK